MDKFIPIQTLPVFTNVTRKSREIIVCMVEIKDEEYQKCEEFSHNSWVNQKKGEWGRGLVNSSKDKYLAERTGNLGEMSFAKLVNSEIDFSYKVGGNKIDTLLLNRYKVEVKTATHNYGEGLVRAVSDRGKVFSLLSDIYVFGYLDEEDINNKYARVALVGFEMKKKIETADCVPAIIGEHLNYAIPYHKLQPISKLLEWLKRKETQYE